MTAQRKPTVDIIIVNWNAGNHLLECARSIVTATRTGYVLDRVVVVDNASCDDSLRGLESLDLPLSIIRNDDNRGFAAACNQGASNSNADWLLFLNPDVRLHRGCLDGAIAMLADPKHSHTGILGIRLVDESGAAALSAARFPTLRTYLGLVLGLTRLMPERFPPHLLEQKDLVTSREVDQVIGAFFLVRTALFRALKGFDERFFVYFEEVDFSVRARWIGFRSYYCATLTATHVGGVSSGKSLGRSLAYLLSSRIKYAHKHYPTWQVVCLVGLTFTVELCERLLMSLAHRSAAAAGDVLAAYTHLCRDLMRRRQVGGSRQAKPAV